MSGIARLPDPDGSGVRPGPSAADFVLPFQIEGAEIRGRVLRLESVINDVLGAHDYPEPVSRILGEALALVALLGSALKFEGTLTLQTKGSGPVKILVADFVTPGNLRGYAQFDAEAVKEREKASGEAPVPALLGEGYLALTIDQGVDKQRYQGIVELGGATLADCAHRYFRESEQIPTGIRVEVGRVEDEDSDEEGGPEGPWRAGAIMTQHLPKSDRAEGLRMAAFRDVEQEAQALENWRRVRKLMETVTRDELLDTRLGLETLLFRLFHEDGVRAFRPSGLAMRCRCSRERIERILKTFSEAEIRDMTVDDHIFATCEFCNATYVFDADLNPVRAS